jgi:tetratricopeptide (TPR) repeat protein
MKPDSIAYVVAGMCFGVMLGWVIGVQQAGHGTLVAPPASAAPPAPAAAARQPPALDEGRVQALAARIKAEPTDAGVALELANVYFDAERWDDAIVWYEKALELDPKNADASTDLGVSYYYTNRIDQALARFEASLKIDPKHTKTMLNKGIVLAFGKQDLEGATSEWQKVVALAPESDEGRAARRALEGVAAAHAGRAATNQ